MIDYAIFIQARLGSTRFPQKVLQQLAGKRVLDHVLESCSATGLPTFLLTPSTDSEFFSNNFSAEVFGGPEQDVLSRFIDCAKKFNIKNIVRITSDCPCLASTHINAMVDEHRSHQDKFVTNVSYDADLNSLTFIPDGFDVEVFSSEMLEKAHSSTTDKLDREHVTRWMRKNCAVHIPNFAMIPSEKFSLDTQDDIVRIEKHFEILKNLKMVRL